jgi:hypothetical protein
MTILSHAVTEDNVPTLIELEMLPLTLRIFQQYGTQGWIVKYSMTILLTILKSDKESHNALAKKETDRYGVNHFAHLTALVDALYAFSSNAELSNLCFDVLEIIVQTDEIYAQFLAETQGSLAGFTAIMNANPYEIPFLGRVLRVMEPVCQKSLFDEDDRTSTTFIVPSNVREDLIAAMLKICKNHPTEKSLVVVALRIMTIVAQKNEAFDLSPVDCQMLSHVIGQLGDSKKGGEDFVAAMLAFVAVQGRRNAENLTKYNVADQLKDLITKYGNTEKLAAPIEQFSKLSL